MNRRIVPMIVDKFDPLRKKYALVMIKFANDYCRGRDLDNPNLFFHFKLHNVDIVYQRVEC